MKEPIVVESEEGLGMKMPPSEFTVSDVAEVLGEDTPVEVIGMCSLSPQLVRPPRFSECSSRGTMYRRRNPVERPALELGQVG